MTAIYMDYLLRVRHLGNVHAASVLPHNQACFHATDRVTQSQHPPVRLHLVSCVSLWVLCSSKNETPQEQGSNSWPKGNQFWGGNVNSLGRQQRELVAGGLWKSQHEKKQERLFERL